MSRKHFIEIAAQLHASRPSSSVIGLNTAKVDALNAAHEQWEKDVDVIASILRSTNPRARRADRFDRERFVAACEGKATRNQIPERCNQPAWHYYRNGYRVCRDHARVNDPKETLAENMVGPRDYPMDGLGDAAYLEVK